MAANPTLADDLQTGSVTTDINVIDHALDLLSLVPEDDAEYHEAWLNAGEAFERIKVQLRLLQAARDLGAMEYKPVDTVTTPVEEVC